MTAADDQAKRKEMVLDLVRRPPPRDVPPDLLRAARNPVAAFLIWVGIVGDAFVTILLVIAFAWLARTPETLQDQSVMMLVVLLYVAVSSPLSLMFVSGLRSRGMTQQILENGVPVKTRIRAVSRIPFNLKGRAFSKLQLEVTTPDGRVVQATDVGDDAMADFFLAARDEERELDALFHPAYPTRAILLARLAAVDRWD